MPGDAGGGASATSTLKAPRRSSGVTWASAAAGAVVAAAGVAMHLAAGYRLPRPWPDESHFITAALALVHHGRLAVPELNAPEGIFWVPHGYYVAQGPLLLLGIEPHAAGRWLSLAGVVGFGLAVVALATRAGLPRVLAVAAAVAWLATARVAAIGNIARPEGLVVGLTGLCLWLVARDRWRLAAAVALLVPLIHPIGIVVAAVVVGAGGMGHRRSAWTATQRVALAAVAVVWVAQVTYFLLHADIAAAHLGFQLTRKAGRAITLTWWQWTLLGGAAAGGVVATLRWRRGPPDLVALWCALATAGGLILVDVVGREMWYEPLGRETAVLLLGLVAVAALQRHAALARRRPLVVAAAAVAVVALAASGLRAGLTGAWYGMRVDAASRAEWHTFVGAAVEELRRVDTAPGGPATVLVDPLSGMGQHFVAARWQRLRFVQPTPATPARLADADYLLVTPGAPFTTAALVDGWPGATQREVRSSRGTYRLQLRGRE